METDYTHVLLPFMQPYETEQAAQTAKETIGDRLDDTESLLEVREIDDDLRQMLGMQRIPEHIDRYQELEKISR